MKVLFDYKCTKCGNIEEKFTNPENIHMICSKCGGVSEKQLSATRCKLESVTGAFPGAYHKWTKEREERARKDALKHL